MSALNTPVVVLADGLFPTHPHPLAALEQASLRICCDAAALKLLDYGIDPDYIVGDMDSLPLEYQTRYASRIVSSGCQETNDLTKAMQFCFTQGHTHIQILGATGGRDDHSLANISLLADYALHAQVEMLTDTGIFIPLLHSATLATVPGMQVSIFSLDTELHLQADGLRYPVEQVHFNSWWKGSLNEAAGTSCRLLFEHGRLLVFLQYP
jgi:thiamine pyrophosphokinase